MLQHKPCMRYYRLAVAQYGHYAGMERRIYLYQLLHAVPYHRRLCVKAHKVHRQQPSREIKKLSRHRVVQQVGDFLGGYALGTHQLVHAYCTEHVAMLWCQQFGIGYSRHCALRFHALGQHTAHQVDALLMQHGYKQVAVAHIRVGKYLRRRRRPRYCQQVILFLQPFQQLRIGVYHRDIVVKVGQRPGQVESHLSVSRNNDIH